MESMSNAPTCCPRRAAAIDSATASCSITCSSTARGQLHAGDQGPPDGHIRRKTAPATSPSAAKAQDEFAIGSTMRAQKAITGGAFAWEVAPVTVSGRKKGEVW